MERGEVNNNEVGCFSDQPRQEINNMSSLSNQRASFPTLEGPSLQVSVGCIRRTRNFSR